MGRVFLTFNREWRRQGVLLLFIGKPQSVKCPFLMSQVAIKGLTVCGYFAESRSYFWLLSSKVYGNPFDDLHVCFLSVIECTYKEMYDRAQ